MVTQISSTSSSISSKGNLLEYLEESWRPDKTCCCSNFTENPPFKTGVKLLDKEKTIIFVLYLNKSK